MDALLLRYFNPEFLDADLKAKASAEDFGRFDARLLGVRLSAIVVLKGCDLLRQQRQLNTPPLSWPALRAGHPLLRTQRRQDEPATAATRDLQHLMKLLHDGWLGQVWP
jgi:hypothetical protein